MLTLKCAKCKNEKPEAEFSTKNDRPSGRQPYCKACNKKESARSNTSRRAKLQDAKTLLDEARGKLNEACDKLKGFDV